MSLLPVPTVSSVWMFHNPVRIRFGRGCRSWLADELTGCRLLVVTTQRGRQQLVTDVLLARLIETSDVIWIDRVRENPGVNDLQKEIDSLKGERFDAALAFGGGSSIDAAKVLVAALAPECEALRLTEMLADVELLGTVTQKPLYAVPTTSGTGSEVTPFATVWDYEYRKKMSLASANIFPYAACVDPELTDTVPLEVTLSTGLDAINQAAESIWNRNATDLTICYANRALHLGLSSLPRIVRGDGGAIVRDALAECSLLAGLAISHTRTALCHSMSYPITAHFGVPHGLACAFTMVSVLRHNLKADDGRFLRLAASLTGREDVGALERLFESLVSDARVKERVLARVGRQEALLALAPEMLTPGRADNNLAPVTPKDIERILMDSL